MEKKLRNGKFVGKKEVSLSVNQINEIRNITANLAEIFKDNKVSVEFDIEKGATIKIQMNNPTQTNFKRKYDGKYMVGNNEFVGLQIKITNRYGYANDPFYSHDYNSFEEQLDVYVFAIGYYHCPRWKKEFHIWQPNPHFDFAYEVDTLYKECIVPAINSFVNNWKFVYPDLPTI